MTQTARTNWPTPAPLTHAERRQSLINATRIRHRHPTPALVLVSLDAPAVPTAQRWDWLDHLDHLDHQHRDLHTVATTDDARRILEQWGEGPWDEPLPEAMARRDEIDAEIDRLVGEAQA